MNLNSLARKTCGIGQMCVKRLVKSVINPWSCCIFVTRGFCRSCADGLRSPISTVAAPCHIDVSWPGHCCVESSSSAGLVGFVTQGRYTKGRPALMGPETAHYY